MTDDQFRALCNTYGFAPSRSLREMLDKTMDVERKEILLMSRENWFKTQAEFEDAIRARSNT